ncbi:hypothetical protein Tco_1116036 [Tanacetum coccineum]
MTSCTSKGKPLALPWGRTPRLDSGVRVRTHVIRGCTHIHVLGDGAQMVGFPCLNGKDLEKVTHPDANIIFVSRQTGNVLRGWVNFEVTHPSILSVLRPTENVLRGWVTFEVTRPGADINKLVDFLDCLEGRAVIGCPGGRAVIRCPEGRVVIRSSAGNVASEALP